MTKTVLYSPLFIFVFIAFSSGCADPYRLLPADKEELRRLRAAKPGLVVLPIETDRLCSCFPINRRDVVTAAHTFQYSLYSGAVQGRPVELSGPTITQSPALDHDWTEAAATTNRYAPNNIDPSAVLRSGDRVLLGGFHASGAPVDPADRAFLSPDIVIGRIYWPDRSESGPQEIFVEVPPDDYDGFLVAQSHLSTERGKSTSGAS